MNQKIVLSSFESYRFMDIEDLLSHILDKGGI